MADNMNSSGGQSKYSPGKQSSLTGLGVKGYVRNGTTGDRPDSSHSLYGGAGRTDGQLFKGNKSAAPTSREMNSGSGEKKSSGNGIYVKGTEIGGVGARTNMTLPGGPGDSGKLIGGTRGKETSAEAQYGKLPAQDKQSMLRGTIKTPAGGPAPKRLAQAKKQIGTKGGPGTSSKE